MRRHGAGVVDGPTPWIVLSPTPPNRPQIFDFLPISVKSTVFHRSAAALASITGDCREEYGVGCTISPLVSLYRLMC
jgi:hypothetical protein